MLKQLFLQHSLSASLVLYYRLVFFAFYSEEGSVLRYPFRILVVLLLAFACGREDNSQSGPVQVVFWHAMGGPLGDVLEDSLIAEFNSLHDDIEILPVCMGNYSALSQKIMAGVMADSPPRNGSSLRNMDSSVDKGRSSCPS